MTADATRLRTGLRTYAVRVANAWGNELADGMRTEAPIGKPSPTQSRPPGELRKSIKADPALSTARGASFLLRAPVIQAVTTDRGAVRHPISIVRGAGPKALRFYSAKAGRIVFAREVDHPGNAAQNWWEPGLRRQARPTLRRAARSVRF